MAVIVSSVPVAYALSVIKWRGQRAVFLLVISTMMLPSQVTIYLWSNSASVSTYVPGASKLSGSGCSKYE